MKKYIILAVISVVFLGLSLYSVFWDQGKTDSSANVMPLAGQVIVLDPGHGGVDGGADYGEDQEKTVTLQTALFLRDYLQEAGAQVVLTRDGDYDLAPEDMDGYSKRKSYDIRRRVKLIQDVEADVFISIHLNSVVNEGWRGAQTFYYPEEEENKRLANAIQQRLKDSIETNRQALAMDNVYILKHAETTSALVEMGFLSNSEERALLTSEDYQRRLASSIYEGVVEYVTAEQEL
ncbi:N-acetylmuramoyl-L-alanine amidase CwlD [Alkalibacillus salilacus]|uniref:N-acetylmuramoyl-L-alanine amidase n=1 Tax=Alkalibacillus salilacus TaxID=284582 RepID=A0ABT9VHA4_9BACI|nr:N-acetylmuramoyl-L-alanine amidase CwlD [Alkalibacillus salilacus]MDQ0160346.1 N-acetylmuramoyl-L-alanine amidase [Alkalibacillus salilacus]